MKRLLSLFLFAVFPLPSSAAPPPELSALRQQYEKALTERSTAPFEAALAQLKTSYNTALANAVTAAKQAGKLDEVLALQDDQKRLADQIPIPDNDAQTPAGLKPLRAIYREQRQKIEEARKSAADALLPAYTARLQQLEATLTKADRIAEAKEVMDYRTGLQPGVSAPVMPASAPAPAPAADTPATPAAAVVIHVPKGKGDDRKAAEWTLSVGGIVELWENQTQSRRITTAAALPPGKLSLRSIQLNNNDGAITKPVTDKDLLVLTGLERLESVLWQKLTITPAAFDVLHSCPEVKHLTLQYNSLGDELWPHLAGIKKLQRVGHGFDSLPVQGLGISQLSPETVEDLFLGNTRITDAGLAEIGKLAGLTKLDMETSTITDSGMPALAALKNLTGLTVRGTNVTVAGLAALKGLPLTSISYGTSMDSFTSQLPEIATLFPKLVRLALPREVSPTADDWKKIAAALPRVQKVGINSRKFTDSCCEGLELLPELEEIDLTYGALTDAGIVRLAGLKKLRWLSVRDVPLTDASLETFADMKKLRVLYLPKPGKGITNEGITKLKRQRPDMELR